MPRRRIDARPSELLEAALDVFTEKGFAGARMEDIAARAAVSKGTIYLYYPSKEAVFEALVRSAILPNLERAEALAAAPGRAAASAMLRQLLAQFATLIEDRRLRQFPRLIIGEAGNFPEMARFYRANVIDRGLALIARIHRLGVERGEFRPEDSKTVARLVVAPMLMAAIWKTVFAAPTDEPFDATAFLGTHAEILLRGL